MIAAPAGGADGTWRVGLTNGAAGEARFEAAGLLVHHFGDPTPHPAEGSFVSAPRGLGARTRITAVDPTVHALFGTSVSLEVRATDTEGQLPAARWVPVAADGSIGGPAVGSWMQLRAVLRGPETDTPRVVAIAVSGGACR